MSIVRSNLAILTLLLGCRQLDPAFCANHPDDADCARRAEIDAGMCDDNEQCMYSTPVCDTQRSMCVSCAADAECASQTCLPDGSCAVPLDVLYVAPDGSDTATCMPGDHCSLARALALIDGTKSTIRLDPARYRLAGTLTLPDDLHLVGRGAVIDRSAESSGGGVLDLAAGTSISLDYVTVQGGDGSAGFGIRCVNAALALREVAIRGNAGPGVVGSGCALAISHAEISGNGGIGVSATDGTLALARSRVMGNRGGGVAVTRASYDLENDIIAGNGDAASLFGGVLITQISAAADHVFAFNTVARNLAAQGMAAGVLCGVVAAPLAFSSSIVVDNAGLQVDGGNCTWAYSDLSIDPLFVDPLHDNFHLQIASPVRDAADPAATLAVDIDGDARPQGPARDMGADEIR